MTRPTHTLRLRAMFGLLDHADQDAHAQRRTALARAARALHARLNPGRLALITGPSGTGKSTLAHLLGQRASSSSSPESAARAADTTRGRGVPAPSPHPLPTPIDLLTGPLTRRLRLLADVGLADAHLFVRPAAHLSVGERARLAIARAIDRLPPDTPRPTLILDEFASTLDRPAADRLCRLLRRWLSRHPRVRVVCLTAHDDLAHALAPDLHLHLAPAFDRSGVRVVDRLLGVPAIRRTLVGAAAPTIEQGTRADYDTLAPLHYRAGPPAVLAGPGAIRRAVDPCTGELLGVLVLAMPTLNAPWRDAIWPGRYRTDDKPADARRLARELRTIARVIVHPEHRGLGIAAALVRDYLAHPLTPATEALAAMGAASPFFAAGGMRACRLPPTERDARLRDALAFVRATPADLLDLHESPATPSARFLRRELRRWASASRSTRGLLPDPAAVVRRAVGALLAPPIVYAHVAPARPALQPDLEFSDADQAHRRAA